MFKKTQAFYRHIIKLDGCVVWNAHYTVLGSKHLAVSATV